jgi:hypothetical protein
MKCLFRRVEFSLDAATLAFQFHWLLVLVFFHTRLLSSVVYFTLAFRKRLLFREHLKPT